MVDSMYFYYLCPMKLSVIIPVFNTASTLEKCLKSVVGQHVDDMEIILVNDGSTDQECNILCEHLAESIPQIRYIQQAHAGLSHARNEGLDVATGCFITFVDADDYLEDNTYLPLLQLFEQDESTDIIEYSYIEKEGHRRLERKKILQNQTYTTFKDYWLQAYAYRHAYMCNKIFRKSLFNNIRFPLAKHFEDVATLPLLAKQSRKIRTTSLGLYHYCWNNKGITANASAADVSFLLTSYLKILQEVSDRAYYESVLNIQLDTYELGDRQLRLPLKPYYGTIKLCLLHILGLDKLCKLNLLYHKLMRALK